jgi:flagellar motor switch protein FliN
MDDLQKEVFEQLGSQLSLALGGMLGETWSSSLQDRAIPADSNGYLCWSQKLSLDAQPSVHVAVANAEWTEIGTRALVAVGLENPEETNIRATYLELLTQALAGLARFLTSRARSEISVEAGAESPLIPSGGGVRLQCLRLLSPTGFTADLFVRIEPVVMEAIRERQPEPRQQIQPEPHRTPAVAEALLASSGTPTPAMDLLLDVEMPVSVSFGRTHLALKDVIKLSTGSIVELDRTISEPVEVIVNNCVIARGEVVVVEGNYGIRIQQIVSRSERLRSFD